jgi:hypothetical protein
VERRVGGAGGGAGRGEPKECEGERKGEGEFGGSCLRSSNLRARDRCVMSMIFHEVTI